MCPAGDVGLGIEVGVKVGEERDFLGVSYSMEGEGGQRCSARTGFTKNGSPPAASAASGSRFMACP